MLDDSVELWILFKTIGVFDSSNQEALESKDSVVNGINPTSRSG